MKAYILEPEMFHSEWASVFKEIVIYLKNYHNAKIISQRGGWNYIEEFDYHMPDCELIIYDEKKDILKAITWSECPTKIIEVFKKRSNKEDILMKTQIWFGEELDERGKPDFDFQLKGTVFYTIVPIDHNYFFNKRKLLKHEDLIDEMFFKASTRREDPFVLYDMGYCTNPIANDGGGIPIQEYLELAIKHKIGLSISSMAEIAYREIEYMACGIPNMHLKYLTKLDPPLIPDYHYISVDRTGFEIGPRFDLAGGPKYIEAYVKRFLETKDDKEFLEFISNNAREYYLKYCSPENRLKHILNKLEINFESNFWWERNRQLNPYT